LREKFQPAPAGEPQVEQDRIVFVGRYGQFGGIAVTCPIRRVAILAKTGADAGANHGVVFDDQDAHCESRWIGTVAAVPMKIL
jgi:hypothetical protein